MSVKQIEASMRAFKYALMLFTLGACLPCARGAETATPVNPNLNDKIFIGLGALYAAKSDGSARLNSTRLGVGTVVNFQNTLGMNDSAWGPDFT